MHCPENIEDEYVDETERRKEERKKGKKISARTRGNERADRERHIRMQSRMYMYVLPACAWHCTSSNAIVKLEGSSECDG